MARPIRYGVDTETWPCPFRADRQGRLASLARTPRRGRGFWYGLAIDVLWPPLMLFTRQVWRGGQRVPRSGGVLLASNHVSFLDPISGTAFVLGHGRIPRYLAKAELWGMPVIGRVLAGGGTFRCIDDVRTRHRCIRTRSPRCGPVSCRCLSGRDVPPGRAGSADAWQGRGCPDGAGHTVPVIPIAHWGGQRVLRRDKRPPRLLPRATAHVVAGAPIDLDAYRCRAVTPALLAEVTAVVMAAITDLLAEVRARIRPSQPRPS
jgi:1-acyl-sn-glycerol-3-phosphate acyltransferase